MFRSQVLNITVCHTSETFQLVTVALVTNIGVY